MFTAASKRVIEENFNKVLPFLERNKADVIERLENCSEDQQIGMKFFYGSMPISDIADYDFETYLSFVNHGLFLKNNIAWCEAIPEDIFLNYILFYRINNEDIEECRKFFYGLLKERIEGKGTKDAALEVNYWCRENVVYQSTDARTASPLTVYRCGSGRCGEESTFTVTALRSVGIPARQIYTPRWAHCDDNHAWVEVWCDGEWHYMGACEPEPVFDKGWFTAAASRAMLIHNKIFSPLIKYEDIIGNQGKIVVLNRLKNYAVSKQFVVNVLDIQGKPVEGAEVEFEVLNESVFYPIASKITDEQGQAKITLGLGSIHIHVRKENSSAEYYANTAQRDSIEVRLQNLDKFVAGLKDFKIIVPEGSNSHNIALSEKQKKEKKQRISHADIIRKEKISSFYKEEEVDNAARKYLCKDDLEIVFSKAKGNFQEIKEYLSTPIEEDKLGVRVSLLKTLWDKDYCDTKRDVLLDHFKGALPYYGIYDEDIFIKYVLCPRIYFEKLTPYRKFISCYFDEETKERFQNNPALVWDYVSKEILTAEAQEYKGLFTSPKGSLEIKSAGSMSKKILFTAICRTIGVPARINKMTLSPEYYQSGRFVAIEKERDCTAELVLSSIDNTKWLYFKNWSLAILEGGTYHTLDLSEVIWEAGSFTAKVPAGAYRLLVSSRMPNGNLLGREYRFVAKEGETIKQEISLPEAQIKDLLQNIPIEDFKLLNELGSTYLSKELVKGIATIMIWLEVGKEPTEHILNEIMEHHKELKNTGCQIIFILQDKEALLNPTLQKTLKTNLNIGYYYGDFSEDASTIARSLYCEPENFPMVFATCDGLKAFYSFSGYNVGIVDLLVKIIGTAGIRGE